jgi:hypothetical protein
MNLSEDHNILFHLSRRKEGDPINEFVSLFKEGAVAETLKARPDG